jgi:hypothetical protein
VVFFRDSKRGICNVYSMYTKTFKVRKQMGWYWWWIPFWLGTELLTFFSEIYGAQCWFSFQLGWTPCCPGWACTSSWAKDPKDPVMMSLDSSPPWGVMIPPQKAGYFQSGQRSSEITGLQIGKSCGCRGVRMTPVS